MTYKSAIVSVFVSFLFGSSLHAQVAGRLTGSVVDQSGAAVPGAKVSVYLSGGQTPVVATETTAEGLFTVPTVRPDYYDIAVESTGFTGARLTRIKVDAAKETAVPPIKLEVAAAVQTVEVSDAAAGVQTTSADVTTTITPSQVDKLPVLDRQVHNLFITQAGVSSSRTVTSINGLRPSYTNLSLDGVNIQDSVRTNSLDFMPNRLTLGQISELTIATSNANPTIGGNATTIALVTPSGTNAFHGNAYWYNRNSFFAANDWFGNQAGQERPFLNLNQLGGTVGGPILKDKLLFYTNYEAYRLRQSTLVTNRILTPEARQGIFRYRDASGAVQNFNVLNAFNLSVDPYIQKLLSQVPTSGNSQTVGDGLNVTGYSFNASNNETRDNVTAKLDYYLSQRHAISGSYLWNRNLLDRPDSITEQNFFYTAIPPVYNDNTGRFLSASWRWNPAPTLTNELRGGFNFIPGNFKRRGELPEFIVTNTKSTGASLIFTSPVSEKMPEARDVKNYAIQDNANWVKGNHAFSFGFQSLLYRSKSTGYETIVPFYTIGTPTTGTAFAFSAGQIPGASSSQITTANNLLASLAGIITSARQRFNANQTGFVPGLPSVQDFRVNNYAPYFSDTWKLSRRVTLVLGLRWEYFSPVDEKNSLVISPRVDSGNPIEALLGNATLDFAGSSVGRPLYHRDLNNFAPNVGFAWDVFGNGMTAIRGGYSVAYAYDNDINSVFNVLSANNGLSTTVSLPNQNAFISGTRPTITAPAFQIPTTTLAQASTSPVLGIIDPNLHTPYVNQWHLSVEQAWKGFHFSGRYVGNHVAGQYRVMDMNQIDVRKGGFLQDFINARNNGFLALAAGQPFNPTYNPALAGSVPLPFFDAIKQQVPTFNIASASYSGSFQRGEAGTLANVLQINNPRLVPSAGFNYWPNPLLGGYAMFMTNFSHSTYNSAQFEVTKRVRNGIQFQANYVFSKALSNALQTRGLEELLDNNSPGLEKARSPFDVTHAFKLNHYVPLPFGPGQRFQSGAGALNRAIEGWGFSGYFSVQSGQPVSILSARGTLNRGARSGQNTVDTPLTLGQLENEVGLFMTGDGPLFINPKHIGPDGRGVAADGQAPFEGQIFFNPQPGTNGSLQRRILSGPWFKNYNFAVVKNTRLTERQSIEFRADFYNLFNHPNFYVGDPVSGTGDYNVNSANFGKIGSTLDTGDGVSSRVVQFGLCYRF